MSTPHLLYFNVDSAGVQKMLNDLDTAINPLALLGFLGATVDPYIRKRAEERFRNEGDDVVGKWVPLASATQVIRAQQGFGPDHPINKRTGELEDYILNSPNTLFYSTGSATLKLPGNSPTGELKKKTLRAQFGSSNPKTPARPVIGMNEADLAWVLSALAIYVERSVGP